MLLYDSVYVYMISYVIISKLISLIMSNEEFILMNGIFWRSFSRDLVIVGRVWIVRRRFVYIVLFCLLVVRFRGG